MYSWITLLLVVAVLQAFAETKSEFRGIVQFVEGAFQLNENGKQKLVEYKDVIGTGYFISGNDGKYVKVVTLNRCVLVLYSGKLEPALDLWRVDGKARIICPNSQKETFTWNGRNFVIADGEVFLYGNDVQVIKGALTYNSKMYARGYYGLSDGGLLPAPKITATEHYERNTESGIPSESAYFGRPPPVRTATSRWSLGVSPAGRASLLHEHDKFSYHNGISHWFRLERSAPLGEGGLAIALSHFDSKLGDEDSDRGSSGPSGNYQSQLSLDSTHLDVMYKFWWKNTFTPYVGLGLFYGEFDVHAREGNSHLDARSRSIGTNMTLGLEKFFFSQSWFSVFFRAEVNWMRTLMDTGTESKGDTSGGAYPRAGENAPFSNIGAHIMFGPMIQFF